jgi:hypothetical protein
VTERSLNVTDQQTAIVKLCTEQPHPNMPKQSQLPPPLQDSFPRPLLATPGLNKREYFAGLAMMGLMDWDCIGSQDAAVVAQKAVGFAEALLAALNP